MSDPLTIGNDNNALAESRRAVARVWFESLRDRICAEVEALEREAPAELFPGTPATFVYKPWTRATGSGGGTGGFLSEGRLVLDGPPATLREGGSLEQNFYRLTGAEKRGARVGGRS